MAEGLSQNEEQQLDGEDFALFLAKQLSENTITADHTIHLFDRYGKSDFPDPVVHEEHEQVLEEAYFRFLEEIFRPRIIKVSEYALEMAKDPVETRTNEWVDYIDQLIYIYRGTYPRVEKGRFSWKGIDRTDLDELVQTKKKRKTRDKIALSADSAKRFRNE